MKRTLALAVAAVIAVGTTVAYAADLAQPLDDGDKQMMKNGAMKNMDRIMHGMGPQGMMKYLADKQKRSQANGKRLFNSTSLSANGRSCATCHPGGGTTGGEVETPMASEATGKPYRLPVPSLIGAAATFPKFKVPNDAVITLAQMDNNCKMMFLGSKPLALDSTESRDLAAYVTSLSNEEKVNVGKMPSMMMK